jgi:N-acetylglucosamine-6-phosphate deacetylase
MNILTTEQFFDGETLHGARIIEVNDDGVVSSIAAFDGVAEYAYVVPGFVDVQMNGFDRWDVAGSSVDEMVALDDALASHGTTSWLATIVSGPLSKMTESISQIVAAMPHMRGCIGIHVEGPFLGSAPGAHNPRHIIDADIEWIQQLPREVRLVTIAAENRNAQEAITSLTQQGIVVSLGHSQPTEAQFKDALLNGAKMVTHLFNGMSGVHHRNYGLALEALTNDNLYAGVIADLVHVQPTAIALAFVAKSSSRLCLVSDSIAWDAPWAHSHGVRIADGAPRLADGTLAGSCTPLGHCVQNVVASCQVTPEDAFRAASASPARLLNMSSVGHIHVGQKADINGLDSTLRVVKTLRRLQSVRA